MIPILYEANETAFRTQGLGALADAVSVSITRVINGKDELTMVYPSSGSRYSDLANDRIVFAQPEYKKDPQPYQIYKITKPMNGLVTVYARHACSQRAAYIPVTPFSAGSLAEAFNSLPNHLAESNPFTFYAGHETVANFSLTHPASLGKVLGGMEGSILDVYGGEYEYDGYTIKLWSRRGTDSGVELRYGKNITDIEHSEDFSSIVTGVAPYWEGLDGAVVSLPEVVVEGAYADTYSFRRTIVKDFTESFEKQPSEADLRAAAQRYVAQNSLGVPGINLKVSFEHLAQYTGYENLQLLETLNLGDTVSIFYEPLDVSATARIAKTVYDCLQEKYTSVQIGSVKSDLSRVMSQVSTNAAQMQEKIQQSLPSAIADAVDHATETITGANGGYWLLNLDANGHPYEMLIMNTPDIATATKVWRFNQNGLGHSNNGYSGSYGLALTADGQIVADRITTGVLTANIIRAGIIADTQGNNSWNLDTGVLQIKNGSINITTSSETSDQIQLKYGTWISRMSPSEFSVDHGNDSASLTALGVMVGSYTTQQGETRAKVRLLDSGLTIYDDNDVQRFLGNIYNVVVRESDDTKRVEMSPNGVQLYTSGGNSSAFLFNQDYGGRLFLKAAGSGSNRVVSGVDSSGNGFLEIYDSSDSLYIKIGTDSDFVVESGYDSPWYWRKWKSGYAEAWARVAHTLNFNNAWGAVYIADIARENYPFSFRSNTQPIEQVSAVGSKTGTDNSCWLCNSGGLTGPTHTQTGVYQAVRPVSGSATIRIAYYVRGLL